MLLCTVYIFGKSNFCSILFFNRHYFSGRWGFSTILCKNVGFDVKTIKVSSLPFTNFSKGGEKYHPPNLDDWSTLSGRHFEKD